MVDENRVACLGKSDGYQMPSQSISARPLPLDHPRRSVIISVKIKEASCQTPISVMDARWPYGSISVVGGRAALRAWVGLGLAQEYALGVGEVY